MDSSLHLVLGRCKAAHCSWGSLRKDGPGWEKAETKFTATSGLPACVCVCVCVMCRLHICTCVFQCVWPVVSACVWPVVSACVCRPVVSACVCRPVVSA